MKIFYYLSWIPLAIADFFVSLLAYPLAPVAVLFVKNNHLPDAFWFLETHDEPLLGDKGHIERWQPFVHKWGRFGIYCQRVAWLWRNKAYNFSYHVTGREMQGPCKVRGNPKVESGSPTLVPGYVLITTEKSWCFFAFIPWLKVGKRQFYVRAYLGWKMKKLGNHPLIKERAMIANHINPFRNIKIG